jgi:hypothetical protein
MTILLHDLWPSSSGKFNGLSVSKILGRHSLFFLFFILYLDKTNISRLQEDCSIKKTEKARDTEEHKQREPCSDKHFNYWKA